MMYSLQCPLTTTTNITITLPSLNKLTLHPSAYSFSSSTPMRRLPKLLSTASKVERTTIVAEEEELPEGLSREGMPQHVAVIMDGNVRWAHKRGLPGDAGHAKGAKSLIKLVEMCRKWGGIKVLSVFAFSFDNWRRSKVSNFFSLDYIVFID